MNNKQQIQLKLGNITSLLPEPAALYMRGFAMLMPFPSLLTHPTGQHYDTQQLGVWLGVNMIHPPASNKTLT